MRNDINVLDDLFNRIELYNPIIIKVFEEKNGYYHVNYDSVRLISKLLCKYQDTITTYCKWCKHDYAFKITPHVDVCYGGGPMNIPSKLVYLAEDYYINYENLKLSKKKEDFTKNELFEIPYISFFEYEFECTKHSNHKYKMFLLIERHMEYFIITKIGQYPSMIDVWGFDFDKYKKQLEKINAYMDFKKAELCSADGFYAGSYTYLRRVFEKMLDKYCEGIVLKDKETETKIKAAKDKFDERIHPMLTNLYKILSKGIHQLDDEQSQNYYIYLRGVIVMQLEFIKEQNDKDEQTAMLNKTLNDIASKI